MRLVHLCFFVFVLFYFYFVVSTAQIMAGSKQAEPSREEGEPVFKAAGAKSFFTEMSPH